MKYYPIIEDLARRAKEMISFDDYRPGTATIRYQRMVDEAAAIAERQKKITDPIYHDKIDSLLDTYARRLAENLNKIKSIKGIGLKTAQRLILELKAKVVKGAGAESTVLFSSAANPAADEATTALVMLGFTKANVNKAIAAVLKEKPSASLEEIIKLSLKRL